MKKILSQIIKNYTISIKQSNVTDFWTNQICRRIAAIIVVIIYPTFITPNIVSIFSLLLTIYGTYQITLGQLEYAAILIFVSFVMDCVDGQLARERNSITKYGIYLDIILDNIKEFIIFLNFIYYFSNNDYFKLSFLALFIIILSNLFDWIRKTLVMQIKEVKKINSGYLSKYGIVFWSGPIRNFIIVFSLLINSPEFIIIYSVTFGLYFTMKKIKIIYNLIDN